MTERETQICRHAVGASGDLKMISLKAVNEANDLLFFAPARLKRLTEKNRLLDSENDLLASTNSTLRRRADVARNEVKEIEERLEQAQETIDALELLLKTFTAEVAPSEHFIEVALEVALETDPQMEDLNPEEIKGC